MTKSLMIALAILAASAATSMAASKGGASTGQQLPSSQVADLTAQECRNLGGTVKKDSVCRSGKTCKMENANGDMHHVCLEAQ